MSAIGRKSQNKNVKVFGDFLKNKPAEGSNASPVSIKAKDLDDAFATTTLIKHPDESDSNRGYTVEYKPEGTHINGRWLPQKAEAKKFDVCENGTPTEYWLVVWDEEPTIPD